MPDLMLQPSAKKILRDYLLSRTEITALTETVQSRKVGAGCCIRFTLIDGGGDVGYPRYVVTHWIQVDCYGVENGDGTDASLLARTAQAVLTDPAFIGAQPDGGVVAKATVTSEGDKDEEEGGNVRPRQSFDLYLTVHP